MIYIMSDFYKVDKKNNIDQKLKPPKPKYIRKKKIQELFKMKK